MDTIAKHLEEDKGNIGPFLEVWNDIKKTENKIHLHQKELLALITQMMENCTDKIIGLEEGKEMKVYNGYMLNGKLPPKEKESWKYYNICFSATSGIGMRGRHQHVTRNIGFRQLVLWVAQHKQEDIMKLAPNKKKGEFAIKLKLFLDHISELNELCNAENIKWNDETSPTKLYTHKDSIRIYDLDSVESDNEFVKVLSKEDLDFEVIKINPDIIELCPDKKSVDIDGRYNEEQMRIIHFKDIQDYITLEQKPEMFMSKLLDFRYSIHKVEEKMKTMMDSLNTQMRVWVVANALVD